MEQFVIDQNEEMVMKLLHFFITEKGYNPIVLHGAKNEIWLENMETESYEIVRIVTNYIHNDDQFKYDLFRTKQIIKRIKKKTHQLFWHQLFLNSNTFLKIINTMKN